MTDDALEILTKAIQSVNPRTAIQNCLSSGDGGDFIVTDPTSKRKISYKLDDYDEVIIVSFGKASSTMALTSAELVSQAWPGVNISGMTIVKDGHATEEEAEELPNKYNVQVREASHPIPDERSVSATQEVLKLLKNKADDRTLVLCCISGGGSALLTSPRSPLTLDDIAQANACLRGSGLSIDKMNVIRKRLDEAKGGRLAAHAAYPSTVVSLILSDVVGDPLDLIASGPTVPDRSSWQEASDLICEYGLDENGEYELPATVLGMMRRDLRGEIEDTPGDDHPAFALEGNTKNILVGNNERAVMSAAYEAENLGYNPVVLGCTIEGEASDVAGVYTSLAEQLIKHRGQQDDLSETHSLGKIPAAIIAGGETTVTLDPTSSGKGGRNQEIGLVAALNLQAKGLRDVVVASAGTDGTDGPTDAAGAVVDGGTIYRIEEASKGEMCLTGKEALSAHDAYTFLDMDPSGKSLIRTGPTGTNVADVCVVLVK